MCWHDGFGEVGACGQGEGLGGDGGQGRGKDVQVERDGLGEYVEGVEGAEDVEGLKGGEEEDGDVEGFYEGVCLVGWERGRGRGGCTGVGVCHVEWEGEGWWEVTGEEG